MREISEFKGMKIASGDQNIFWDALLKIEVLKSRGLDIEHLVHGIDAFGIVRGEKTGVNREYCTLDGNTSQWTPSMEIAEFLGRMPEMPKFGDYCIKVKKILKYLQISQGEFVKMMSQSDWHGVSINGREDSQNIADKTLCCDIKKWYRLLRKTVQKNMEIVLGRKADISENFPGLCYEDIGKSYCEILSGWSKEDIQNTFQLFSKDNFENISYLLKLFMDESNVTLYNEAIDEATVGLTHLGKGELPFFVVIKEEGGYRRLDLSHNEGKLTYLGKQFKFNELPEEVVAIAPKALVLFMHLRSSSLLAIPKGGSSYNRASFVLAKKLGIEQHPVVFIEMNALDNMKGINEEVYLPAYLQGFFGSEIKMDEIAQTWRAVVADARAELEILKNYDRESVNSYLLQKGVLDVEIMARLETVKTHLAKISRQNKSAFVSINKQASDSARRLYDVQCGKEIRESSAHYSFYREELLRLEGYIEFLFAQRITLLHQVAKSLEYWNNRPFLFWTKMVGGGQWHKQIIENANFIIEE